MKKFIRAVRVWFHTGRMNALFAAWGEATALGDQKHADDLFDLFVAAHRRVQVLTGEYVPVKPSVHLLRRNAEAVR